jgi:hypothetical protein
MKNKIRKKFILIVIVTVPIILAFIIYIRFSVLKSDNITSNIYSDNGSIKYMSKADTEYFYVYMNKKWVKEFIKGVNIGAAKPGSFPGDFSITKNDYLRWFNEISNMNANAIRVYTILKPDFYDALYEYNKNTQKPLYLFQGVWINEEDISKLNNAYDSNIKDKFIKDIQTVIDVIHGNKVIAKVPGYAYGRYEYDISPYVAGFVLGIEWDPDFVINTDELNKNKNNYNGKYLYTENASPFETFLCEAGDKSIAYETDKYKMQRPVSFANWVTTDMLKHTNEPLSNEDKISVNMEHIKGKPSFKTGLFASYHIYPYYPDSFSYQKNYVNFKDSNGKINPYKAYLKDLRKEHTMPVLVAEFGVPSSRGMAHENLYSGFNQGNISEKNQGEMDASMLKDIYEEGYAGGLIFEWQDEWFKRTWNTMNLDMPDRRPYWDNIQSSEQHFGLLSFDAGIAKSTCYIDGSISDWEKDNPTCRDRDTELYMKSDETYVYFMIKDKNFDFNKDKVIIPIDTIQNQGNSEFSHYNINFDRPSDFVVLIDGKNNSKIMIDPYYDSFQYLYGNKVNMIKTEKNYDIKNSGSFLPIYLCISKAITLPEDKTTVPFQKYETGRLVYGNGNPDNKDFNSLADFFVKGNVIELKISWQLLSIMDPSEKMAMNDFHKNGLNPIKIDGIYAGVSILKNNSANASVVMNYYNWKPWKVPKYHERLKESYYILKDEFSKY